MASKKPAAPIEIITKDDLEQFRVRPLRDIQEIIQKNIQPIDTKPEGFKTAHIRQMLGCSINKLVSLRIAKKLRVKKIGGTLYYNKDDVKRLLEEGY